MSRIGNYVQELIEDGVIDAENHVNDRSPDFMDYAKGYMATDEYKQEHDAKEDKSSDDFIESINGRSKEGGTK